MLQHFYLVQGAWPGKAGQGRAGQGKARNKARLGKAWQGEARQGGARQGEEHGKARESNSLTLYGGTMSKEHVYFGGVPTDPDVKKIREVFPEERMQTGQIIPYSEIESLLRERRNSNRWKGVTARWRKTVEDETGMIIGVERGTGFKVLKETEKLDLCGSKLRSAATAARRSYDVATKVITRELSNEEKSRLNFYVVRNSKILAVAQVKSRESLLPELGGV